MPVKIYTRTTCAPCRAVKSWLQKKGIAYTEINVDENPEALAEIMDRTGLMMVPMTLIGDRAISGMNFGLLSSTLGLT